MWLTVLNEIAKWLKYDIIQTIYTLLNSLENLKVYTSLKKYEEKYVHEILIIIIRFPTKCIYWFIIFMYKEYNKKHQKFLHFI